MFLRLYISRSPDLFPYLFILDKRGWKKKKKKRFFSDVQRSFTRPPSWKSLENTCQYLASVHCPPTPTATLSQGAWPQRSPAAGAPGKNHRELIESQDIIRIYRMTMAKGSLWHPLAPHDPSNRMHWRVNGRSKASSFVLGNPVPTFGHLQGQAPLLHVPLVGQVILMLSYVSLFFGP